MRTRQDANQDKSDGFTLVELLIVITIMSILAAIAVPLFVGQRTKGFKAAMAEDLHTFVTSEVAWSTDNNSTYTTDLTALAQQGYKASPGVVAHVKLGSTAASYVACVKHPKVSSWLIYDSSTGSQTSSATDCA
jgi:type IV pilus assembly protein PilA